MDTCPSRPMGVCPTDQRTHERLVGQAGNDPAEVEGRDSSKSGNPGGDAEEQFRRRYSAAPWIRGTPAGDSPGTQKDHLRWSKGVEEVVVVCCGDEGDPVAPYYVLSEVVGDYCRRDRV